jgi:two-component system CheB/CheR fusion protein
MTQEQCSASGWQAALHPDDVKSTREAWEECRRNEAEWDFEHRFRGQDGRYYPVLARGGPVRNDRGEIVAWAGINLDVRRWREAEARLRQADQRKDDFLAVVAHELRNPLAPLRNALAILKTASADGALAAETLETAERQVQHLARLVDDLLDVSRITHGRIELRRERVELSTVVARAVETSLPAIEAQGHEFTVSLPDRPVWLNVDLVRMAQVVSNLLNNAAQYTTPGGRIRLSAESGAGQATLRISDTGIGIRSEDLPRIFDMFTQSAPQSGRAPTSLGIGLRLVKTLVEMHRGSVEATSPGPRQGSEFVVRLPVAQAPPPRASPKAKPPQPVPLRRVLVVDDNADAALSMAVLLRLDGHTVSIAQNGAEAIEAVRNHRPEVVLLDIGMPGMDGYEVARRLREQKETRLLLVALTGWGQERDRQRSQEAGFDHHLTKPVDPSQLQQVLASGPAAPVAEGTL